MGIEQLTLASGQTTPYESDGGDDNVENEFDGSGSKVRPG